MSQDNQSSTLLQVTQAAQERLAVTLQRQGLQTDRRGDCLHLNAGGLNIRCTADNCQTYPQGWMVQLSLDISVDSDATVVIRDTLVGVGETLEAAISEAVTSWFDGVFSPSRAALCAAAAPTDVSIYDVATVDLQRKEETSWEAYAGPFQIRGSRDRREPLAEQLAESPPLVTLLINTLTDLLTGQRESVLGIKLFLHRQPDGQIVADCKVNDRPWVEGQDALSKFSWPSGTEGMQFKQFVVIKRARVDRRKRWPTQSLQSEAVVPGQSSSAAC